MTNLKIYLHVAVMAVHPVYSLPTNDHIAFAANNHTKTRQYHGIWKRTWQWLREVIWIRPKGENTLNKDNIYDQLVHPPLYDDQERV